MTSFAMVTPRLRTSRTVPRQAIVALFQQSPRWPEVSTALALDVLAVMGSANGFNLALGCMTATDADAIAPKMPAGVELHVALADAVMPAAVELARSYAQRGFERIVVIGADTIGVSTRMLSTASSMLESEPVAIGPTPEGQVFAVAASDIRVLELDEQLEAAFGALTAGERLTIQALRLEPLIRLREIDDLDRLTEFITGLERVVPRTVAVLQESN